MNTFDFLSHPGRPKANKPEKRPAAPVTKKEKEFRPYVKIDLDAAVTLLDIVAIASIHGVSLGGVRAEALDNLTDAIWRTADYIEREKRRRQNAAAEKREQEKCRADKQADFRDFMGI